ncbi:MAG: hypothetical protein OEZ68_21880 [Gammaproteobacteria bacterium]|nr:hypothetical protein [Gammaproteobacteria bacterium]MDH5803440.1 hypothetical protein [Gammaproteobacteria bacterium]
MHEFNLDKRFVILSRIALAILILFALSGLGLPYLASENGVDATVLIIVTISFCTFFGFLAIFAWIVLRKIRYADVVVDKDGIWYKHKGKDHGLVSWGRIEKVKERAPLQCLDLIGADGAHLLRVEYQLIEFERLRDFINERVRSFGDEFIRSHFAKGVWHHLFYLLITACFVGMAWYVGAEGEYWFAGVFGVLVIFLIYEYFTTVISIAISTNSLEIGYPARKKSIPFSNILDVVLNDEFVKGSRIPEVEIILSDTTKPLKVRRLDVDSNTLHTVIKKALRR